MSTDVVKKIMIVAGEQSGDILGAGLIRELKRHYPECEFFGIGGPLMISEGFRSLFPIDRLSVMGFIDPLLRLPELLRILKRLKREFADDKPSMFIGIDSPDFNNKLEKAAKKNGIFSVHYVSPSVWAWRQGRIKSIKKTVDLMLTLFPFEAAFYQRHNVKVCFVGHPLADRIPLKPERAAAIDGLDLDRNQQYCALLPGSRRSELSYLLPVMADATSKIIERLPNIQFLIPAANTQRRKEIDRFLMHAELNNVQVVDGQSHEVMAASDCVVMASGTTTLEAMLLKKPMVIIYKMSAMSFWVFSKLVKIQRVGLPNLLAGKDLVPELLQERARGDLIAEHVLKYIASDSDHKALHIEYETLHKSLKKNASISAANAITQGFAEHRSACMGESSHAR